jgi:molybdenum cofactor biosynthesis enzyme MoaA
MNRKDTFCILPFVGMNVHINGGLTPCCYQDRGPDVKYRFQDYQQWRQEGLADLKRDLLTGVRNSQCRRCWDEEDAGADSYRQQHNKQYPNHPAWKIDVTEPGWENLIYDFRMLHLEFDSLCNLRCIMCHPTVSTSLETEYKLNADRYQPFTGILNFEKIKWTETEQFEKLLSALQNVDTLMVTGGEPLTNPTFIRLLKSFPNLEELNISVTTNATVIKDDVYELLSRAKTSSITVSLEGIGAHNDYLRHGSDWDTVDANIQKLAQLPNWRWIPINIATVLQYTSLWSLSPLIDYCVERGYNLRINHLHHPDYLTLSCMEDKERKRFVAQLRKKFKGLYISRREPRGKQITYAIDTLLNTEFNAKSREKFFSYVGMLDSVRGTKFHEIFDINEKRSKCQKSASPTSLNSSISKDPTPAFISGPIQNDSANAESGGPNTP